MFAAVCCARVTNTNPADAPADGPCSQVDCDRPVLPDVPSSGFDTTDEPLDAPADVSEPIDATTDCTPRATRTCYSGPPGTAGVGTCVRGVQHCGPDGAWPIACEGERLPARRETCGDGVDDDCNGVADDRCAPPILDVALGGGHSLVLLTDGSVRAFGNDYFGQLGDGDESGRSVAVPVLGLADVTGVAAGGYHSCGLRRDGSVWCWGANWARQLGHISTSTCTRFGFVCTPMATRVAGIGPALLIGTGYCHTCVGLADRSVVCWGCGGDGQLGRVPADTCRDAWTRLSGPCSAAPIVVSGLSGAIGLSLGENFTCGLMPSGQIECLGGNRVGQLGDGTTTDRMATVPVVRVTDAVQVSASGRHAAAVLSDGSAVGWGQSTGLGLAGSPCGAAECSPLAEPLNGGVGVAEVRVGGAHLCYRRADGGVACLGSNDVGQLGDGTAASRAVPAAAIGLTPARRLFVGAGHSCVLLLSGVMRCWGAGAEGQLGNGAFLDSSVPVDVVF